MEPTDNPFAQVPNDPWVVVALGRRAAAEECPPDRCLVAPILDRCVYDAVSEFWGSRIKTFVPPLALRRVRCCIRSGTCDCGVC